MLSPSNPIRYKISFTARKLIRNVQDSLQSQQFSRERLSEKLPHLILTHSTPIYRDLPGVDKQIFDNKKINLRIAIDQLDGILLEPGKTFSFWNCVGNPSRQKGYLPGLIINKGLPSVGVGGGLCQVTNSLHWLVLHSDLSVLERHRHSFDIFPDDSRLIPFGTGATIVYSYKDFRALNATNQPFQFCLSIQDDFLVSELRSVELPQHQIKIEERDHQFQMTASGLYRSNSIWRVKAGFNGEQSSTEFLFSNFCRCQYDLE